jgi:hypothetical protein
MAAAVDGHARISAQLTDRKINDLKTPVLVESDDADGSVEWHQSMDYYQSAADGRHELGDAAVGVRTMISGTRANQIANRRHINEWFGHYLKGEPAPKRFTEGMTWLDRSPASTRKSEV